MRLWPFVSVFVFVCGPGNSVHNGPPVSLIKCATFNFNCSLKHNIWHLEMSSFTKCYVIFMPRNGHVSW